MSLQLIYILNSIATSPKLSIFCGYKRRAHESFKTQPCFWFPSTRCLASAALSLAYVAKGTLDTYQVDYLKPWDVAAGVLLVREAGGVVHNTNGSEFNVMKPNLVAASKDSLAQEVIELIKLADQLNDYKFT